MAKMTMTMQAAIFQLSQLKTEMDRTKNAIVQFHNYPLSVNQGPPADTSKQEAIVANALKRMKALEEDYLTLQDAIDQKNRESGTGHLLNEVTAKRRRLRLLEPLASIHNAPGANYTAENGVGLVEYGLPGYNQILEVVTDLRDEVNQISLAIDQSNALTEIEVNLKTLEKKK
ncbi:hypothetical protein ACKQTC_04705 [Peptococcus simiae]|uniref:Uncharacterized protein n=1 Tax=Peptococcus simiae TaxID=1643805 RepID=A0ABW9GYM2_9FIRM